MAGQMDGCNVTFFLVLSTSSVGFAALTDRASHGSLLVAYSSTLWYALLRTVTFFCATLRRPFLFVASLHL